MNESINHNLFTISGDMQWCSLMTNIPPGDISRLISNIAE